MNYLNARNIQQISTGISPVISLHPTSISYIQALITPYAQVLDTATTVDSIINWVPQALERLVYANSVINAIDELSRLKSGLREGPEFLETAKRTVIDDLIRRMIRAVNNDILFYKGDNVILPWDIKESMFFDDTLAQKFGITKGDDNLPVDVTIENNVYTHQFNEELTMGLLLYSLVAQKPIRIQIFGIPFSYDYYLNPDGNRYTKLCHNARRSEFSVIIGGITYCFITAHFMQGFATGAGWFGDDHRLYWSELISYEAGPSGIRVNF